MVVNNQDYTLYCMFPTYLASYAIYPSFSANFLRFARICLKKNLDFDFRNKFARSWIRIRILYADPDPGGKSYPDLKHSL